MLVKLLAFLAKDWEQARSYRLAFVLQFGGVGLTLVGLYFMNRLFRSAELEQIQQYGGDYVSFILVGLVVTLYSGTTLRAFAPSLRQAQVMGTLEVLLMTRARLSTIMFGWAIYPMIQATMSVIVFMVGGFLILDASFENANIIGALATVFFTLTVMISLGDSAAVDRSRRIRCHRNAAEHPVVQVCHAPSQSRGQPGPLLDASPDHLFISVASWLFQGKSWVLI